MYLAQPRFVPEMQTYASGPYIHSDYLTEREMFSDDLGFGWSDVKRIAKRPVTSVTSKVKSAGSAIRRVSNRVAKTACSGVNSQAGQAGAAVASQIPNPYAQGTAVGQQVASLLCNVGYGKEGSATDRALAAISKLTGVEPATDTAEQMVMVDQSVPITQRSWFLPAVIGGTALMGVLAVVAMRR